MGRHPGSDEAARGRDEAVAAAGIRAPLRWYDSLYVRVIALCGVLLLFLLGSVTVLSRYYLSEVITEMKRSAEDVAERLVLHIEDNPDVIAPMLDTEIADTYGEFETLRLQENVTGMDAASVTVEPAEDGQLHWVARIPIRTGERNLLLSARVTIVPQTELVRAFQNQYLRGLTAGFIITLGLMVYFIWKTLRPLRELSDSIAAIPAGELRPVSTRRAAGEVRALEETFNRMVDALRDKEEMESKLRQAQRVSSLGNLAAGVAHDVRNPLNAIKLLSSHTLDLLGDDPQNQTAAKQLRTIRNEVGRLEEIVSNFLSLARDREIQPVPTPIDALLRDCAELVRQDAEQRAVRLLIELRAGDLALLIDPKAMTRAVLNILFNALEACPAEGRVRLFSRRVDTRCEIEVRDDGPGLPDAVAERVFEPYYTTKINGTGLGLSITRGIVEEHGGRIELYSRPGQGVQVVISLPIPEVAAR